MQFIEKVILSLGKALHTFSQTEKSKLYIILKNMQKLINRCCLKSLLLSQARGNTVQYKLQYDINLGKSVYPFSQTDKHNTN